MNFLPGPIPLFGWRNNVYLGDRPLVQECGRLLGGKYENGVWSFVCTEGQFAYEGFRRVQGSFEELEKARPYEEELGYPPNIGGKANIVRLRAGKGLYPRGGDMYYQKGTVVKRIGPFREVRKTLRKYRFICLHEKVKSEKITRIGSIRIEDFDDKGLNKADCFYGPYPMKLGTTVYIHTLWGQEPIRFDMPEKIIGTSPLYEGLLVGEKRAYWVYPEIQIYDHIAYKGNKIIGQYDFQFGNGLLGAHELVVDGKSRDLKLKKDFFKIYPECGLADQKTRERVREYGEDALLFFPLGPGPVRSFEQERLKEIQIYIHALKNPDEKIPKNLGGKDPLLEKICRLIYPKCTVKDRKIQGATTEEDTIRQTNEKTNLETNLETKRNTNELNTNEKTNLETKRKTNELNTNEDTNQLNTNEYPELETNRDTNPKQVEFIEKTKVNQDRVFNAETKSNSDNIPQIYSDNIPQIYSDNIPKKDISQKNLDSKRGGPMGAANAPPIFKNYLLHSSLDK